ncbi:SDR family NAD(P)-dependent oxidoreductase [Mycobacterium sp. NPDC050551]|uniref:SDR family NAD(P)-dependent oxidoreductase n=1 Tax=Mycobacterium sp. NPDC050551 TaxID=3155407 RepID=UPI0034199A25
MSDEWRAKYGPWALVAGASDGVGAAFAEAAAQRGVNVVLLARRAEVLDEVADGIRRRTGVATRVLVTDLSAPDAVPSIVDATSDLDIGLMVYCAGADADFAPFLENSVAAAESMLRRNCLVPMQLAHHLGRSMVRRGHGGIVVLSSGAGFVGAPNMVTYGATKAFDMIFAEALWCELRPQGVDVLGVILGETDTPSLRRLRAARGLAEPDAPVPGATTVDEVVDAAFTNLGKGPTCMAGRQMRWGARLINPIPRGLLVRLMVRMSRRTMGSA